MTETKTKRDVLSRWLGNVEWQKYGLNVGEAIKGEGPGEGFAMYPWALDRYARALRLRPGEHWLAIYLLKHKWDADGIVYISLRRLSLTEWATRDTLRDYVRKLEKLGYIRRLGERVSDTDHRVPYDVGGLLAALAICIAADPASEWARRNGGAIPIEAAAKMKHTWRDGKVTGFNLDFGAILRLAEREGVGREIRHT